MIFEYYIVFSWILIPLSLFIMIIGICRSHNENRISKVSVATIAFVIILGLGESRSIAHIELNALVNVLAAFFIAIASFNYIKNKSSYLIFTPCVLMLFVIGFNLMHESIGLSILGRWTA